MRRTKAEYYEYDERKETLMDRFPYQGYPEGEKQKVYGYCSICDGEIYENHEELCAYCEEQDMAQFVQQLRD